MFQKINFNLSGVDDLESGEGSHLLGSFGNSTPASGEFFFQGQPSRVSVGGKRSSMYLMAAGGGSQTDDAELFCGMPENSVRVLIWEPKKKDDRVAPKNSFSGNTGHVAMLIKKGKDEHYYISLYHQKTDSKKQCCVKLQICCGSIFTSKEPRFFRSYYPRIDNSVSFVPADPEHRIYKPHGNQFSQELQAVYKTHELGEDGQQARHLDYMIEIGFADAGKIDKMIAYYTRYVQGSPRWRALGDSCCVTMSDIFCWLKTRPSPYQNCTSLCYNILREGGVFDGEFPTASSMCWWLLKTIFLFGGAEISTHLVDNYYSNDKLSFPEELEVSAAVALGVRLVWVMLSFLGAISSSLWSQKDFQLRPVKLKERLIEIATDGSGRAKIVHVGETLKSVCVVRPKPFIEGLVFKDFSLKVCESLFYVLADCVELPELAPINTVEKKAALFLEKSKDKVREYWNFFTKNFGEKNVASFLESNVSHESDLALEAFVCAFDTPVIVIDGKGVIKNAQWVESCLVAAAYNVASPPQLKAPIFLCKAEKRWNGFFIPRQGGSGWQIINEKMLEPVLGAILNEHIPQHKGAQFKITMERVVEGEQLAVTSDPINKTDPLLRRQFGEEIKERLERFGVSVSLTGDQRDKSLIVSGSAAQARGFFSVLKSHGRVEQLSQSQHNCFIS